MTQIHQTAVVDPKAELGQDVVVQPGAVVGPHVRIGDRTVVGAYSILDGHLCIGKNNVISPHAVLGTPPQDYKYRNEPTRLEMGDDNIVREFVTVHRGTPQGRGVTRIGSGVFLMAYSHIAHDNIVEDHVVVANGAQIGGHVTLGTYSIVGGCCAIHQYVRLGPHSFIGGGSIVVMDVAPFCKATGNRARLHGLNVVGLKRRGFSEKDLKYLKIAYRLMFHSGLLFGEAMARIHREVIPHCEAASILVNFAKDSPRGMTR